MIHAQFSILGQTNVTTEAEGNTYLKQFFFPQANASEDASVLALYPSGLFLLSTPLE